MGLTIEVSVTHTMYHSPKCYAWEWKWGWNVSVERERGVKGEEEREEYNKVKDGCSKRELAWTTGLDSFSG